VSARPSDAIALAARLGTTIYAEDALLDAEGVVLQPDDEGDAGGDQDDLVVQFREFIEGIRPEDFSS
jgi:bifunctional DNase/RNase